MASLAGTTKATFGRRAVRALEPTRRGIAGSYSVLFAACVIALVPFLYVLSTSFKETQSLFSYPPDWLPSPLFLGNYVSLVVEQPFLRWTVNTLFVATAVTFIKVFVDAAAAYALAKMRFAGKGLVTLVLLFSLKGDLILTNPLTILWIAIPLSLQTVLIFALTYVLAKWIGLTYEDAAPSALIGSSNHFEVAIATATMLFGLSSGAALATVVGVLIEVPLMLALVVWCRRTAAWFPREAVAGAGQLGVETKG